MNEICKEYIKEVKKFFPNFGKDKRLYLKKLSSDVENYCDEMNITAKSQLYENYGRPNEVVNNYFNSVDLDYVIKRITISKRIKSILVVLMILMVAATSIICYNLYSDYLVSLDNEVTEVEEIIE